MSLLSCTWLVGKFGFKCRNLHWFLLNFILLVQPVMSLSRPFWIFKLHQTYSISLPALSHPPNWYDALCTFQDTDKKTKAGCSQRQSCQKSLANILPHNLGTTSMSYNATKRWKSPYCPSYPQGQHESLWRRLQRSCNSHLSYLPNGQV